MIFHCYCLVMSYHTVNLRMMKVTLLFFLFTKERKGKFHSTHYASCVRKTSSVAHVFVN